MIFKYGRQKISIEIPDRDNVKLLCPKKCEMEKLTPEMVSTAYENLLGGSSIDQIFRAGQSVTILVSDITRYSGAEIFLLPLLDRLVKAGCSDKDITILFSNGTHRKQTDEERKKIVGEEVYNRVRCVDHVATDAETLVDTGFDIGGFPLRLNRLAVQCERLIITGAVGFHYLAGFGGGRKAIMPGVASLEDAKRFHSLSLDPEKSGRHPCVESGNLENNPMHLFATQIMNRLKPALCINSVMDADGRPIALYAGDPEETFMAGTKLVRELLEVEFDGPADMAIVSCGGYPKDLNMIQAHKSFDNSIRTLKKGGRLFLMAQCEDGAGSETFLPWFKYGSPEKIEKELRRKFVINGQTAFAVAEKSHAFETVMLTQMNSEEVASMGIRPISDKNQFVKMIEDELATGVSAYLIENAGFILPIKKDRP